MAVSAHPKLSMARRMLTLEEIRNGVTPFNSAAWRKRRSERRQKELARIGMDTYTLHREALEKHNKMWMALPWYKKTVILVRHWIRRVIGL